MKVLVDKEFLEGGLELICDSIRLKTGGTGVLAFPVEMKAAVDSITGSGGITPTGTKEIGENGTYDVTSFASAVVDVPTGIDTSDANAVAADLASGKTAYADGVKVTGTQPERAASDLTAAGAQVTVPAGLYREQASKSVATATQATPSMSVDNETGVVTATANQSAGYVPAGTKSATLQLATKAAQTYTPGAMDQTIPAGRYTTGVQTIKGDARLVAGNIKKNVSIFGVEGNYSGETGSAALRNESRNVSYYGSVSSNQVTARFTESNVIGVVLHHSKSWPSIVQVDPIDTYIAMPGTDGTIKVLAVTRDGKSSGVIDGTSLVSIGNGQFVLNTIPSTYLVDANFDTQADAYRYTLITA